MSTNDNEEVRRIVQLLEGRSDAYVRALVLESQARSQRTIRAMAKIVAGAVLFLIAAMCFLMVHVERSADLVTQISALADSNGRWIAALKVDEDLQAHQFQTLTVEVAKLRAAILRVQSKGKH